jgi:UDP-glucose 4-epimerase
MLNVAVTGANGFIGKHLCPHLLTRPELRLTTIGREPLTSTIPFISLTLLSDSEIINQLADVDCVIHLAARAHKHQSSQADFQRDNVDFSERMARIAALAGVKQFIYLSSVKALGNSTVNGAAFNHLSVAQPQDIYGQSKLFSEEVIKKTLANSATQFTIVRPPLVWGRDCKGNLKTLINLINKGLPLPFENITNRRDIISIENLCYFIQHLLLNPLAMNQNFLVCDGIPRTTAEIVKLLQPYATQNLRLYRLPLFIFRLLRKIPALQSTVSSFYDNLEIDMSYTQEQLQWKPKC